MTTFEDKTGQEWTVELDAPTVEAVRRDHGVDLVNLDQDPLQSLRNDPMKLVAVIYMICQDQIQARNLTPDQFGKLLPFPPDVMLEAVGESIVNFFPTGRHSHVREVLASYGEMAAKTDDLTRTKMTQILQDPRTMTRLDRKATQEIEDAIEDLFPLASPPDESSTVAPT